jgi:hypothetical protein
MSQIFGTTFEFSSLATILLMGLPAQEGWHFYRGSLGGREIACG